MIMNPGMLLFGLVDSGLAFFLVFNVVRAKFGGIKSTLARTIGSVLGTIVFIVYFGIIVWFNTSIHTVSSEAKIVVYAAPIVLTILMAVLVLLSQPPKKKEKEEEPEEEASETETEE